MKKQSDAEKREKEQNENTMKGKILSLEEEVKSLRYELEEEHKSQSEVVSKSQFVDNANTKNDKIISSYLRIIENQSHSIKRLTEQLSKKNDDDNPRPRKKRKLNDE